MTPKVPSSETGTATAGIRLARQSRRNRKTTRITSPTAISSVRSTSRSEARMVVVRSIATVRSMPLGIAARSCGSSASTRSTVSMRLAPGWRDRITSTEGLPLAKPWFRRSSTELTTSAMSLSRTAALLR